MNMKTKLNLILSAFVILHSPFCTASWVEETSAELATTGDWDGDENKDLFVLDRASGILRVALGDNAGSYIWLTPVSTGVLDATAISFGKFNATNALAITTPTLNRVNLMRFDNAQPEPLQIQGVGPGALVTVKGGPGALDGDLVIASELNDAPDEHLIESVRFPIPVAVTGLMDSGNEIGAAGEYGMIARNPNAAGSDAFRLFDHLDVLASTLSLPLNGDWAYGDFAPAAGTSFLFWVMDQPALRLHPLTRPGGIPQFGAATNFTMSGNIFSVTVIDKPNATDPPRLLIIFDQGASAGVFDFDGVNPPVLARTLTPESGKSFRHAHALNGDFVMFSGASNSMTSDTARRWRRQADGSYVADPAIPMPALPGINATRANVLLFTQEPFVAANAQFVSVLNARDWTSNAAGIPGALSVMAEAFEGGGNGLRSPQVVELGGSPVDANFALTNQYAADLSIISYAAPRGSAVIDLTFAPTPGKFISPVSVSISTTGLNPLIYYRTTSGGSWANYTSPLSLSANTTLLAYSLTSSGKSPVTIGRYTFGSDPLRPASSPDTNNNGLADEWEDYFGLADPNGDADNDGLNNQFEFDHHTDPTDPHSGPNIPPGPSVLSPNEVRIDQGKFTFRMNGTPGRRHQIQWSLDLGGNDWHDLGAPFYMPNGGFIDLEDDGIAGQTRRFYRAVIW